MLMKTEKGRLELRPGHRSLGQRERALLLVADGQQTESQMASLFNGDGRRLLDLLLDQGYLERRMSGRSGNDAKYGATPGHSSSGTQAQPIPAASAPTPKAHGDSFAGAPSLASARMFLFDLSERLFAPRDKAMALRYRDALREARDPKTMLQVGQQMIADVQALAGADRADNIRDRLTRLLPQELVDKAA